MSFRRLFVGDPGSKTSCASTFRRPGASRHRSVDVAAHHFRTPVAAAERSSSPRGHFWMTLAHHQQSTHAGARALAGYQMSSPCRVPISLIGGRPAGDFTNVVNTTNGADWNRGISMTRSKRSYRAGPTEGREVSGDLAAPRMMGACFVPSSCRMRYGPFSAIGFDITRFFVVPVVNVEPTICPV
jgi:hypothetical protein